MEGTDDAEDVVLDVDEAEIDLQEEGEQMKRELSIQEKKLIWVELQEMNRQIEKRYVSFERMKEAAISAVFAVVGAFVAFVAVWYYGALTMNECTVLEAWGATFMTLAMVGGAVLASYGCVTFTNAMFGWDR